MTFKRGIKKTGGRTKGTPNKKTKQWEALCELMVGDNAEAVGRIFEKLLNSDSTKDQIEAVRLYKDILKFFKPAQSSIDAIVETSNINKLIITRAKGDKDK